MRASRVRKALPKARAYADGAENIGDAYARLRLAFDAVPEGVALLDSEDRYVLWNRRYAEFFTHESTKIVVGARFEDTLRDELARGQYPEAQGREGQWLQARLERHARSSNVEELQLPGERWIRIEERRTPDGGSIGVRIDITDLKRREASFRMLFESHPLPMWVWDPETFRFLAVNDAAIAHYGYSREQFMAMTVFDMRPAEDWKAIRQVAREPIGSRRTHRMRTHVRADGSIINASMLGHTLPYAGRIGCLAVAIDITDRIRAEDELRRTKSVLDTVLDHVPAAITVKDAITNRYVLINRKGEDFFCLGRDQAPGGQPTNCLDRSWSQSLYWPIRLKAPPRGIYWAGVPRRQL